MTKEEFDNLVPGTLVFRKSAYSASKIYTRMISKNTRPTDGISYDGGIWGIWFRDWRLTIPVLGNEILFAPYSECEIIKEKAPIESDPEYEDLFI